MKNAKRIRRYFICARWLAGALSLCIAVHFIQLSVLHMSGFSFVGILEGIFLLFAGFIIALLLFYGVWEAGLKEIEKDATPEPLPEKEIVAKFMVSCVFTSILSCLTIFTLDKSAPISLLFTFISGFALCFLIACYSIHLYKKHYGKIILRDMIKMAWQPLKPPPE